MIKQDINRKRKINQAINFLEELSWFFDSKKSTDFKEIPSILRSIIESDLNDTISQKYSSDNQNKNTLVGILPNLFLDVELFKSNSDLAEFSESVLKITIPRFEKRSRYEIIGLIVCEVPRLNDADLSKLVEALTLLGGNTERLRQIKADKKNVNFTWNETIQKLNNS